MGIRNDISKKYLKLNRKHISYLQFLIESYEGVATVTTVDEKVAIIELLIMPDFASDVEGILDDLRKEIDFIEERSCHEAII